LSRDCRRIVASLWYPPAVPDAARADPPGDIEIGSFLAIAARGLDPRESSPHGAVSATTRGFLFAAERPGLPLSWPCRAATHFACKHRRGRLNCLSGGPKHADAHSLGGIAQIAILGRERQAEPHRQLQISGIVSGKSFFPRKVEHTSECA
jgi:hypothetical protein